MIACDNDDGCPYEWVGILSSELIAPIGELIICLNSSL